MKTLLHEQYYGVLSYTIVFTTCTVAGMKTTGLATVADITYRTTSNAHFDAAGACTEWK